MTLSVDEDGDPLGAFGDTDAVNGFLGAIAADADATIKGASLAVIADTVMPTMERMKSLSDGAVDPADMAVGHGYVMGATDQGWADVVQDEHFEDAADQNSFLDNVSTGASMIGLSHPAAGGAATVLDSSVLEPMRDANTAAAEAAADQSEDEIIVDAKDEHQDEVEGLIRRFLIENGYSPGDAGGYADQAGGRASGEHSHAQTDTD